MKSFSILLLLLLISFTGIKAQKPILVSEDSITFGKGKLPGLSVTIPEVNYEKTLENMDKRFTIWYKIKIGY